MPEGQPSGDSTPLTVRSAASVLEGLLSDEPEHPETDRTPADTESQDETEVRTEDEGQPEQSESEEQSDETPEGDKPADEQEETEEEETPEPRNFKVKVDGEEIEVTEEELLKGYSRTADYTRKTQKHSEEVKTFKAEADAVRAERQKYAESLTQIEEALKTLTPAEPDWDKLRTENPEEFAVTWAAWDQHKKRMEAIAAEKQQTLQKLQQDQMEQVKQTIESEKGKLVEAIPAWKDAEVAKKEKSEIASYAKGLGYSDEDLSAVYDHRVMVMLRKAMLFDKAEKAKPDVRKKIEQVKTLTPGPSTKTPPKKVAEQTKAKQRLAKTGRVRDAAALIEMTLDD